MPGGKPTMISGTSLAAPQVSNLACKLLAVDPNLSVAKLREIILSTATEDTEGTIMVIHPARAMASLQGS